MDSAKTLNHQGAICPPRTRTGLAFLDEELLSAERGEEPNLDRVLRALDIISDDAKTHAVAGVDGLCQGLRIFIADLREDGLALSLEDLDMFLVTSNRLRGLMADSEREFAQPIEKCASRRAPILDLEQIEFAPEFLSSGLVAETWEGELRLGFPNLVDSAQIARVIADLEDLWLRTPQGLPWRLDMRSLERIPVAILACLTKLRISEGADSRLLRLHGELSSLQSEELSDSLARYFQLI